MGFVSVEDSEGVSIGFTQQVRCVSMCLYINHRPKSLTTQTIRVWNMWVVMHLVRSSDAVITVGGRMGSLHELATALESRKGVRGVTG